MNIFDMIGLTGVACYIYGFVGLQVLNFQPQGYPYLICNLLGAILTLISLAYAFNLASFVSQIVWLLISVISMYKQIKNRAIQPMSNITHAHVAHDNHLYQDDYAYMVKTDTT